MIGTGQPVWLITTAPLIPARRIIAEVRYHAGHTEHIFFSAMAFQAVTDDRQFSRYTDSAAVSVDIQKITVWRINAFGGGTSARCRSKERRVKGCHVSTSEGERWQIVGCWQNRHSPDVRPGAVDVKE